VGFGSAVRVPLGDLEPRATTTGGEEVLAFAAPGGMGPFAFARWGPLRGWSVGALAVGSTVRLEALAEARPFPQVRLLGAVAPYGGFASREPRQGTGGGEGWRLGGLLALALGLDLAGVLEGWVGVRFGLEHVEGWVGAEGMRVAGHLTGLRGGACLGLAAGLRRLHVLVEIGLDDEWWRGALGGSPVERHGVALTPAFGLRVRI
jgi:hypothetical protein